MLPTLCYLLILFTLLVNANRGLQQELISQNMTNGTSFSSEKAHRPPNGSSNMTYWTPTAIYGSKLLVMTLSFDISHCDALDEILQEYLNMCEGGWDVTVIFYSTVRWSPELLTHYRRRTFCYRISDSINFLFSIHHKDISINLASVHRKELALHVNNYDLFLYHEDDIIFRFKHLVAYVQETKRLELLLREDERSDYGIGFLRYRRILRKDSEIHAQAWGDQDVLEQDNLEELPTLKPVCVGDEPYIKAEGNTHQAMWILTRAQIITFQSKCDFLNQTSPSREYMSSLSIFYNNFMKVNCRVMKMIPAHRLQTFAIRHFYPSRHPQWSAVHATEQRIREGLHYLSNGRLDVPPCWSAINETTYNEGAL